jgi:hypothetical protein
MKKQKIPICGNCYLFDREKEICKISILIDGKKFNMPVNEKDNCHMLELEIPIEQVKWWVEDPSNGEKTNKNGIVKMEYPENFFGNK